MTDFLKQEGGGMVKRGSFTQPCIVDPLLTTVEVLLSASICTFQKPERTE